MYEATSASKALISIWRAPSRASSSNVVASLPASPRTGFSITLSIGGVSFLPAATGSVFGNTEGYAAFLFFRAPFHNFGLYLEPEVIVLKRPAIDFFKDGSA